VLRNELLIRECITPKAYRDRVADLCPYKGEMARTSDRRQRELA